MTEKGRDTRIFDRIDRPARWRLPAGRTVRWRIMSAAPWVLLILLGGLPAVGQSLELTRGAAQVNDGDTFSADLNGNGRLDLPQERVRLLYVDTPELSKSGKGKDLRHGVPAREFLIGALAGPVRLVVPDGPSHDNYGRTLAVVRVGGREVNLELVRQGHSPFDTRFSFPAAYDLYARAEAEAFLARRGIWSDKKSRQKYLRRLKREGKTPRAVGNPLYLAAPTTPQAVLRGGAERKFVRIGGKLGGRKRLGNGAWVLSLRGAGGGVVLPVFVAGRRERQLRTQSWPPGAGIVVDGFIKRYKGRVELTLHHGRLETGK